jgi:hypothetical protein
MVPVSGIGAVSTKARGKAGAAGSVGGTARIVAC